jgi:hypothetical protein
MLIFIGLGPSGKDKFGIDYERLIDLKRKYALAIKI